MAAAIFFVARHVAGQVPFGTDPALSALFHKWRLGPLRLLNFAVLAIIAVQARPLLVAWSRQSPIATLGRASLTVFGAHLVICLALLAAVGDAHPHLHLVDEAILAGTLVALYGVARAQLDGGKALRARGRVLAAQLSARMAR